MQRFSILAFLFLALLGAAIPARAQTYTSYFTGDPADVHTISQEGLCLMGGATENSNAMRWFLQRSGGGDILVLRASGSDGYNDYLSSLGVPVNSVETIVMPTAGAALAPYVVEQIRNAEALWIAGGDQWDYVSFWKNKPVEEALRYLIHEKKVPMGGTSAGMAILGNAYFSAQNGTITSADALANPFDSKVTLGLGDFLDHPILAHTITDTHFDSPDRRGRLVAFMARLTQIDSSAPKAIACEEYTAVCIDSQGIARVFGDPTSQDFAYFVQVNCAAPNTPETCQSGQALAWNRNKAALKAYKVKGTQTGDNYFDLSDWENGSPSGGTWQHWWAENGLFKFLNGTAPNCSSGLTETDDSDLLRLFPNPADDSASFNITPEMGKVLLTLRDESGKTVFTAEKTPGVCTIPLKTLPAGLFYLSIENETIHLVKKIIVQK